MPPMNHFLTRPNRETQPGQGGRYYRLIGPEAAAVCIECEVGI